MESTEICPALDCAYISRNHEERAETRRSESLRTGRARATKTLGNIPDPVSPSPLCSSFSSTWSRCLYPLFPDRPSAADWLCDPTNILRDQWPRDWPSSSSRQVVNACTACCVCVCVCVNKRMCESASGWACLCLCTRQRERQQSRGKCKEDPRS